MSNANHTPGPWKAHPIELHHGLPYTPVSANTLLAKVYSEAFGDHAESEANARLIAAAPELLEALDLIAQCASAGPVLMSEAVGNICSAAIAKAKGE